VTHVVIIGNGITGVTAARRVRDRRPDWRITVISGESTHAYSRPALMYIFMGHMRYQDTKLFDDHYWTKHRIDLVRDWVTAIDPRAHRLTLHRGGTLEFDHLLLATGSVSNRFGWPGQDLPGVQGLYDLMDLRLLYQNARTTARAVIVGGGLIGIELAEMLHSRGIHVTFLVREASYWSNILPAEESAMVNRLIRDQGMGLELRTELKEIVDDGTGRVTGVITSHGSRLDCQLVGLTAGVSPNTSLARDAGLPVGRGVLVDFSLRTEVPGVYAAGDCAELVTADPAAPNLIQQVWYTGRAQGEVVGDVIAGHERGYDPGIWYNSAKFLDLEYQTYGRVNMRVDGEESLHWEHPTGRHAVRVSHVRGTVIGLNFMGLRHRHRVCEAWIRDGRSVEHVIDHLGEAGFDAELSHDHLPAIQAGLRGRMSHV
jgi:NAD(P)H-nitrite reductase large subunit